MFTEGQLAKADLESKQREVESNSQVFIEEMKAKELKVSFRLAISFSRLPFVLPFFPSIRLTKDRESEQISFGAGRAVERAEEFERSGALERDRGPAKTGK